MSSLRTGIVAALACSITGCALHAPYRYTALTPAPRPIAWDGRTPREGLVAEGSVSSSALPSHPDTGTSTWVAEDALDAFVGVVPLQGLQTGLHASYASFAWAKKTSTTTMPLPEKPSLFGIGPDVRASLQLDRGGVFAIGVAGRVDFVNVPFARWRAEGSCPTYGFRPWVSDPPCPAAGPETPRHDGWVLDASGSELHVVLTGGVYPSIGLGPHGRYGRLFGVFAVTNGFSNRGSSGVLIEGSTLSAHLVGMVGGGYGFDAGPVHASATFFAPVGEPQGAVDYGAGMQISLGIRIGLWRPRRQALSLGL